MSSGPETRIVGGGVIGLSIARRLQSCGANVTVFDACRMGSGASWAAAGMLAPGGEFEEHSDWSKAAIRSLKLYPDFVRQLEEASGVPIDFRVCGAFELAYSETDALRIQARAANQGSAGIYSEQFPASRVPGIRAGACAAQYYPYDAVVNPRELLHALRMAAQRAGVKFREHSPIRQLAANDPYEVTVLAAGAWSSGIDSPVRIPETKPVRGHLVAFDEYTGLCDSIVRHDHTYLLRRAGNVIVAGSSTEDAGFERTVDGSIAADIARRAGDLIPALAGSNYVAWNGLRPASDSGPVMQRVEGSNLWLAYGHYRNGILLAPYTAETIAGEIMQTNWRTDSPSPAARLL
jgi:glycine oxidase